MNFTITKEAFVKLLYLANSIVERKTTMPILANVNLTADKNKIAIYATDLEISLAGESEAEIKTPGSITVDGRVLYEIVRELPAETVHVTLGKNQRLEIEAAQARFKINGISSDEFPSIVGTQLKNPVAVDATKLYEMLDKTAYAVSTDETRYNINGVYAEVVKNTGKTETLRFVATDGHRMAMIDRPAEGLTFSDNVIIPRKGIQELKKVLENNDGVAYVGIDEGFFTLQSGNVTLGVRLIDGQFPDYRQVIPSDIKTTITVSKEDLHSAVKRVSLLTTDKSRTIKFKLVSGNLVISSQSPEYGEATESVIVQQQGEDVTVGFSARYILDLLTASSRAESITIKLTGDLGPGLFQGTDDDCYSCVVMPMRFE